MPPKQKRVVFKPGKVILNLKKVDQDIIPESREAMLRLTEKMIGEARNRAPLQFGELRDSDFVEPVSDKDGKVAIEYGFNAQHAKVMDQGWEVTVIKPKKAKKLFIPISNRAKRGAGAAKLKYGKDYVLVKRVPKVGTLPKARFGRSKGPNKFLSGTVKRFSRDGVVLVFLAKAITAALKRNSKVRGA